MARGRLVALEGIDGAGKSTLARALVAAARRRGLRATRRREPFDPALGRLAQEASVHDAWAGAVYFTIDRFLARPSLERDLSRHRLVVTDRSFYSTLAYQGSALGREGLRRVEELSRRVTVVPDRVVLLDLDPAEALRRLGKRGRGRGPLERRRTLERVARRYRQMAKAGGWLVLDATEAPGAVAARAVSALGLGGPGGRRRARDQRT